MSKRDEELRQVVAKLLELYPVEQALAEWDAMSEEEKAEMEDLFPERLERM